MGSGKSTGFEREGVSMSRKKISLILMIISLLGLALAFLGTQQIYYSDGPWSGRIMDAETKRPIEGAVVVAMWDKIYPTIVISYSSFFDASETLTDSTGNFVIPAFKAINFTPFTRIRRPTFEIFKPGYSTAYTSDSPLTLVDHPTRAEMFKGGVVLELRKVKTREERLKNKPSWPVEAGPEKLPLFYALMDEESRNLGLPTK